MQEKYKYISDAQYSFQKILDICVKACEEDGHIGTSLFKKSLKFIVAGYKIIGKPQKNPNLPLESKVKIFELRNYIQENFLHDMVIKMAKYMISEMPLVTTILNPKGHFFEQNARPNGNNSDFRSNADDHSRSQNNGLHHRYDKH